jgi:hypothetical protein
METLALSSSFYNLKHCERANERTNERNFMGASQQQQQQHTYIHVCLSSSMHVCDIMWKRNAETYVMRNHEMLMLWKHTVLLDNKKKLGAASKISKLFVVKLSHIYMYMHICVYSPHTRFCTSMSGAWIWIEEIYVNMNFTFSISFYCFFALSLSLSHCSPRVIASDSRLLESQVFICLIKWFFYFE